MQALQRIYDELGAPNARQLRFAALRENVEVSPKQVEEFVKLKAERQLFRPPQLSDGKTASLGPGEVYQADIIDLKQFGKNLLAVIDPFQRKMALEVLPNKKPLSGAQAFRTVLNRMPTPKMLTTDGDQAFKLSFDAMLNEKNIVHKFKRGINTTGTLDKGIQTVKRQLFQRLVKQRNMKLDALISKVEGAYNNSYHSALGTTPEDASKDNKEGRIEQFHLMRENAQNFEHNHDNAKKKMDAVKEQGAFRVQQRSTMQRGFKPQYSELKQVATVERSQVTDTAGRTYNVNEVQAVPVATQDITPPDMRGRGLRDNRLRTNLKPYAEELHEALGDQEISLTVAARQMSDGFKRAKPATLLMKDFLKLFPNLFTLVGQGPATRVRKGRRRIRGKQSV